MMTSDANSMPKSISTHAPLKPRSATWRKPPPARISTASLTAHNIGTVKKINSVVFPISYSTRFYTDVLVPEMEEFNRLVYYNDVPVACICCKLDKALSGDTAKLYIATMGVLAPYRSLTIGHQVVSRIVAAAAAHTSPRITHVYLHVQVSNTEARKFYEREGFKETGLIKGYYQKIEPSDAWLLEREVSKPEGGGEKGA